MPNDFNVFRQGGSPKRNTLSPQSDAYANAGFVVLFEHVPSGQTVSFKAFITAFNDSYNPEWAEENVFGRPDPIYTYKSTRRSVSLGLKIPAASTSEGFDNLGRVQKLVQFLYPSYTNPNEAQTIAQSPLVRMKIMNLFADRSVAIAPGQETADNVDNADQSTTMGTYKSLAQDGGEWEKGNLGVISNLAVNHNLETSEAAIFEMAKGVIIPQLIEINLDFGVIHEHPVGWGQDKHFKNPLFPYGINLHKGVANTSGGSPQAAQDQVDSNEASKLNNLANYAKKSAGLLRNRGTDASFNELGAALSMLPESDLGSTLDDEIFDFDFQPGEAKVIE